MFLRFEVGVLNRDVRVSGNLKHVRSEMFVQGALKLEVTKYR